MKTVTVSIDDETYRRSCAKAAEAGTDVQELVRAYLCEYTETEEERNERHKDERRQLWARIKARGGGLRSRDNLTRAELYDHALGRIDDAKPAE